MDFNNIVKYLFSLHICLCTLKNIAFSEMWLFNANLNCILTQSLRECPTFSHCVQWEALKWSRDLRANERRNKIAWGGDKTQDKGENP